MEDVLNSIIEIKKKILLSNIDSNIKNDVIVELDSIYTNIHIKYSSIKEDLNNEKFRFKYNILSTKSIMYLILCCNFLLFPLINFIAKCYNSNSPQIMFELDKLLKLLLPLFN